MKRLLSSLVALTILAACSGPTGVDQPVVRLDVSAAAIPPSPCAFCPFGPEEFTRSTAPKAQPEFRSFAADPTLVYDLVIVHTGGQYTETQVIINGTKYVFDSRSGAEFRQTLLLQDQNSLSVKVFGPQGSSATVWFEALGDPT
jgi:hypothetical protein